MRSVTQLVTEKKNREQKNWGRQEGHKTWENWSDQKPKLLTGKLGATESLQFFPLICWKTSINIC